MDFDQSSIASDFSVITDSMANLENFEAQAPIPMNASFFRSGIRSESGPNVSSEFRKVKFSSVFYLGHGDTSPLSVAFSYSDDFTPSSSDRIALYKVGFSSSKDFLLYKWVPTPNQSDDEEESSNGCAQHIPHTVVFEVASLPSDPDGFYQICYLMQNGQIAGISSPFQLKQNEVETGNELEDAARKVLSLRIRELMKENNELREKHDNLKMSISRFEEVEDSLKSSNNDLVKKNEGIVLEFEEQKQLNEELKNSVAEKDKVIEKLQEENAELKQEVDNISSEFNKATQKNKEAVEKFKTKFEANEKKNQVFEERLSVLTQDNQEMKETMRIIKEELDISMQEKAAAEKVASDLSEKLRTPCTECQTLLVTNNKLTKKVKKLKKVIDVLEISTDGWTCVSSECHDAAGDEDKEEEGRDDASNCEISSKVASINTSAGSQDSSICPSSVCSLKLSETVSTVKRRMDDIVHQLSEQTEEMKSLKREIASRNQMATSTSLLSEASSSVQDKEPKRERNSSGCEDEKRVLYGKTFLPAPCTAPVFFPTKGEVTPTPTPRSSAPSAPSPTPSMNVECILPPPLLPTSTLTALNAAVLRQFSDGSVNVSSDPVSSQTLPSDNNQESQQQSQHPDQNQQPIEQQQEQEQISSHEQQQHCMSNQITLYKPQESDDDDFHSTGDEDQSTIHASESSSSLKCPFCSLVFIPDAYRLMEEHINNHMDRICPVCSLIFQKSIPQSRFEDHVNSHFNDDDDDEDEEERNSGDPSGPWDPRGPSHAFQLLEID